MLDAPSDLRLGWQGSNSPRPSALACRDFVRAHTPVPPEFDMGERSHITGSAWRVFSWILSRLQQEDPQPR